MQSNYMLPTDEKFVESIAKSIAKNRILNDAGCDMDTIISQYARIDPSLTFKVEQVIDDVFENIWNGMSGQDTHQREMYKEDARAAISAINLKLLMIGE